MNQEEIDAYWAEVRAVVSPKIEYRLHYNEDGDITMAHLGIWSRKDPWAPAVLEQLIINLKGRGFCFGLLPKNSGNPSK